MKNYIVLLFVAGLNILLTTSCTKRNTPNNSNNNLQQQILGKWMIGNREITYYDVNGNLLSDSVTVYDTSDYFNFLSDNYVQIHIHDSIGKPADDYTEIYSLPSSSSIAFGTDTYIIDTLNTSQFFFSKTIQDTSSYSHYKLRLVR